MGVEVPDEGASGDYLGVAVVQRQPAVAHVLTVDAFRSRGDADDLRFLHICAYMGVGEEGDTLAKGQTSRGGQICHS